MKTLFKRLSLLAIIASVGFFLVLLFHAPQELGIVGVTQIDHEAESARIAPLPSAQAEWPYLQAQEWSPDFRDASVERALITSKKSPDNACAKCHSLRASPSGGWQNYEGFVAALAIFPFGMIVNATNLSNLFVNIVTTFNKAFEVAESQWQKIAMLVPSTSKTNDYKWLGNWPKLREWVGERNIKSLEAFAYTITNKKFESTIAIDVDDLDDDNVGILEPQARESGRAAAQWPDDLIAALINGGFTQTCFDGQNFFDTDHPVGDGVYSNKGTGVLSAATLAASQSGYGDGRQAMMAVTDDEGNLLNIRPNLLVVPAALEAMAKILMTSDKLSDNSPNPWKGTAEVVVWPLLTSTTKWFLFDTTRAIKALVFQQRQAPTPQQITKADNDHVFMQDEVLFGVKARGNAGYGLWQMAYGSDGTV